MEEKLSRAQYLVAKQRIELKNNKKYLYKNVQNKIMGRGQVEHSFKYI
jgi:hypothetical protein